MSVNCHNFLRRIWHDRRRGETKTSSAQIFIYVYEYTASCLERQLLWNEYKCWTASAF